MTLPYEDRSTFDQIFSPQGGLALVGASVIPTLAKIGLVKSVGRAEAPLAQAFKDFNFQTGQGESPIHNLANRLGIKRDFFWEVEGSPSVSFEKKPTLTIDPNRHSKSTLLHELGHLDPRNRPKSMPFTYAGGKLLSAWLGIPFGWAAGKDLANGEFGTASQIGAGAVTASMIPVLREEIRASNNARRYAKQLGWGKPKGLKRALGTYGISALTAAGVPGLAAYLTNK